MQKANVVDVVPPSLSSEFPDDASMRVTGTLRQRGDAYLIEQQVDSDVATGPRWTTPRIRRVTATDATRDAARSLINQVVTITGIATPGEERNRPSIVFDSIEPFERESDKD